MPFWQPFHILLLSIHVIQPINHTKWWIIKVKHPSLDIYRKDISLMNINNLILVLCTRIILSSFVIYFFCMFFGKFSYYINYRGHFHISLGIRCFLTLPLGQRSDLFHLYSVTSYDVTYGAHLLMSVGTTPLVSLFADVITHLTTLFVTDLMMSLRFWFLARAARFQHLRDLPQWFLR